MEHIYQSKKKAAPNEQLYTTTMCHNLNGVKIVLFRLIFWSVVLLSSVRTIMLISCCFFSLRSLILHDALFGGHLYWCGSMIGLLQSRYSIHPKFHRFSFHHIFAKLFTVQLDNLLTTFDVQLRFESITSRSIGFDYLFN